MNKKTYLIEKAEKGLTIQQYLKQIAGFSNAQIRSMKFTENGGKFWITAKTSTVRDVQHAVTLLVLSFLPGS